MAITKRSARQSPISARVDFALADLTSGTAVPAVDLPANARILRTFLRITTAFNSGTTDAMVIQSSEGTPKAYITISAGSGALAASKVWSTDPAIAGTASSNVGFINTAASTLDVKWTGAGTAATTGAGTLLVEYIVDNREAFSQDNS